jgi:hypothetical protein
VDLYVFTCSQQSGRLKLFIAAESEAEAIAEVRRRGYADDQIISRVWSRPVLEVVLPGRCVQCG